MHRPVRYLISSNEQGVSTIDRDSIRDLMENTALSFRPVRSARCKVNRTDEGLVASCRALLTPGTNMSQITSDVQRKVKDTVEELTGLTLLQFDMKSKYESSHARNMAVR